MKTRSIPLITALLVLAAAPLAVPQVGPDDWYFEIDGDYWSVFTDQEPARDTYLWSRRIIDGEGANRHETYAPKQGIRIDAVNEPDATNYHACTDWYHVSDTTYMGAQAYRVQANFLSTALLSEANPPRRSEQMLLRKWFTGLDSARYFTLAFRFNAISPDPSGSGGFITQWHHGGSGGPPILLAWNYGQNNEGQYRYYLRCWINKDSPTDPTVTTEKFFYVDPASPGVWHRMLFQVDLGPSAGWTGCEQCPTDQGVVRAWMMNPTTGEWELLKEYTGQIGYWWRYDQESEKWVYRTGEDHVSYQWKVGHYAGEQDWVTLDYDNVAYGKRWNNITKNRLIGYQKSVLNLRFDEGTGTAANDNCWSWNGGQQGDATMDYDNDGSLVGSVAWSTDGVGSSRRSLYFTGGYVNVPIDTTDFDFGNYVTVSAWFNTTATATQLRGLVSIDQDDNAGKLYLAQDNDQLSFGVRHPDGTYSYVTYNHAPGLYADGQWHHVAGTFNRFTDDNRRVKLYIDGVRMLQREGYDKPILRGAARLVVGTMGSSGGFIGRIDEVNVLNYTMTDAEVATLTVRNNSAATLVWDGGSPSTGTWTADANWVGNVQPRAGDFLIFPAGAARPTNTNTFGGNTVFGGIIFQGDNYNIYGNAVTLTNHITAEAGASANVFRPGIQLGAPAYLRAQGSGVQLTLLGNIDLNGHDLALVCQPGQLACGGVISGAGDVTKSGSGRAVFSGGSGNTYSGTTYVLDGILDLSKYILINPGGVRLPRIAVPGSLVIGLGTSSLISDAVVCNANDQIAANAQVTVRPTGELNFNGYNNTIYFLRMSGGHVTTGAGVLTVTGNIVGDPDADGSVISGNLNLGANGKYVILNDEARLTIAAVVSGAPGALLRASGGGELRLTANNTYAGQTVLNSGTLRVSASGALGAGSNVTLEGGRLVLVNSAISDKQLTVTSPFSDRATMATEGSSSAWNGNVVLNGFLDVLTAGSSSLTWTGQVSGTGGFLKLGPGLFRLGGTVANTYEGFSAIDEGVLELAKVFSGSNVAAISGTTLDIGDGFSGPGTDLVRCSGPGQVADTANVNIQSSGRLQMQGWSDHVGALYGPGEVDLGGGTLTVGGNGFSTTFGGVISGAGSLVKTGATTLTLTGTSTYTGNTAVRQGTLLVHGRLNGSSLVNPWGGATLGGTGRVNNVFVSGSLAPGASAGNFTVGNLQSAGALDFELNGTTAGADYDRVTAEGTVTLAGVLRLSVGFNPPYGHPFVILNKTSPGPISGAFTSRPEGAQFPASGFLFQITYTGGDGNDVVLTRLPAPASTVLGARQLANGSIYVFGQGLLAPNQLDYMIEATTNLSAPIPWTVIGTAQNNSTGDFLGQFGFRDTNAPLHLMRFYRVRSP